MASIIPSPAPQFNAPMRTTKQDIQNPQPYDGGRATPLPQYEKTQSVPFTLTLQEEKDNPGQFQLVVNIDQKHQQQKTGSPPQPTASKKLIASLKEVPSLGYDVSPLYHTLKSSPPSSPQDEKQGWSDLDAIPPEFLNKVVPDWKVTFSRSDSTASSQSRKLADIKARIKKSGKGFVVRLLKGSTSDPDTNDVAEVHLGSKTNAVEPDRETFVTQELPADTPPVELDTSLPLQSHGEVPSGVLEIGSSSEPGIPRSAPNLAAARLPSVVNQWLHQVREPSIRASVLEEGLSDAETLLPDVRSLVDRVEDTDIEPFSSNSSVMLGRSGTTLSIVKTPTRGLSVVGPVKRVQKAPRAKGKGKAVRTNLNRSGAHKSLRRSLSRNQTTLPGEGPYIPGRALHEPMDHNMIVSRNGNTNSASEYDITRQTPFSILSPVTDTLPHRRHSDQKINQAGASKSRLRLQTDVPQAKSANTSPVTKRKRKARTKKAVSLSSSVEIQGHPQQAEETSPVWSEVDPSEELRAACAALGKTFGNVADDALPDSPQNVSAPNMENLPESDTGGILPPYIVTRMPPPYKKNPTATFLNLALTALIDSAFTGLTSLRNTYGSEPPVPPKHVRVRWTCSCGDSLYDDFIENKQGAARDLEWYLNRPRSHSPSDPPSKSSTFTSMNSMFDVSSRASTLATPASTYAGNGWGKQSDASRYSPTRLRSNNPFSVHIGTSAPESWLLTCANEGRFTPKVVHIDVNNHKIKDDRDLALAIRDHYERVNKGWFKWARLRGLSRIEFAQFEVHRNRFADIRAVPSMPPVSSPSSEKSPSQHPYTFVPHDLMPPVGSAYLMHLFKHPEDYEGENSTYQRAPKRRERLGSGMGWGINLVEGFQAQKVWAVIMLGFGIGSAVFAVLWTMKRGDVQGAFGVASWIVTLAGLGVAGLQAWLD
ncbi:hypothetical protein DM02DRAFT_45421 [Periconia macrospinosa]|uniref:Uncharacterized protein n=1 Tax=Periconia macrospinosa TaxID=97972 RepID=A0A2V1DK35_9PLEO|nr:hypothetical protein DM02DRAFT_45421 [Periconia macrospinosa]